MRELPSGLALGGMLGIIGVGASFAVAVHGITSVARLAFDFAAAFKLGISTWLRATPGMEYAVIALTVGLALLGVVTFGSLAGSMLPFLLRRLGFDPASASAPFVATLVDVTGIVIYFSVAAADSGQR